MGGGLPPFMPLFRMDATGNSGVIIDSGTSVARLVESAYTAMREAFRAGTGNLKSARGFSLFDTCYDRADNCESSHCGLSFPLPSRCLSACY